METIIWASRKENTGEDLPRAVLLLPKGYSLRFATRRKNGPIMLPEAPPPARTAAGTKAAASAVRQPTATHDDFMKRHASLPLAQILCTHRSKEVLHVSPNSLLIRNSEQPLSPVLDYQYWDRDIWTWRGRCVDENGVRDAVYVLVSLVPCIIVPLIPSSPVCVCLCRS